MVIFFVLICFFVGLFVGLELAARLNTRRRTTMAAFRPLRSLETGYRQDPSMEVLHTQDEVVAAVRAVGFSVRETGRGFDVIGRTPGARLEVHVPDRARITLASLDVLDHKGETHVFEVALALVPLFGPMTVTEAAFGRFLVDGTRDHHALAAERGERIRALAQALQLELAEKQALYANGGVS